jgi:hypothetical protein
LVCFFFIISETKRDTTEPDRSEIYVSPEESQIGEQPQQVPTPSESISVEVGTSYESNNRTSLPSSEPVYNADPMLQTLHTNEPTYQNTVENVGIPSENIEDSTPKSSEMESQSLQLNENETILPVSYNSTDPEPEETTNEEGYDNPADAALKFNRTVYNFGTIRDGAEASTLFVFTNIGDEPLEIEVVSACFCMTVDHTRDLIQKGEKGNIDVVFDSNDQVGNVKKDIDVIFKNVDKKGYPLIKRLTIKGKVIPK